MGIYCNLMAKKNKVEIDGVLCDVPMPRPPFKIGERYLMLDPWRIKLGFPSFIILLEIFKTLRFFNIILLADNLQGDGEIIFVFTIFSRAFKIQISIADLYCIFRCFPVFDWRIFHNEPQ